MEISRTIKITSKWKIGGENGSSYSNEIEKIETPISKFNKKTMCNYIIENGEFASPELLKLAVAFVSWENPFILGYRNNNLKQREMTKMP